MAKAPLMRDARADPDASQYSVNDLRARQDICVGNNMVRMASSTSHQSASFLAVKEKYVQTNAAFQGMQASGVYRSWVSAGALSPSAGSSLFL